MSLYIFDFKLNKGPISSSRCFEEDVLVEFSPFLIENTKNILFSLACNYLSLGQFELARSAIRQLFLIDSRRAFELINSIIFCGPPPDWQLSSSIPTSAHLILACIKEFRFLSNILDFKDEIILKKTELDLLITNIILSTSNRILNYRAIKEIRQYYHCFCTLIFTELPTTTFIPELKLIPKIAGLPSYLSRIPSYLLNLNSILKEFIVKSEKNEPYFSKDVISELVKYSISFPKTFCFIVKLLMMKDFQLSYFENGDFFQINPTLKMWIKNTNISLQWIVIKSCYSCINFFLKNNTVSPNLISDTILSYFAVINLEDIFDNCDLENSEKDDANTHNSILFSPEDAVSIIVFIFCLLNLFCKYSLNEVFLKNFLTGHIEIFQRFEDICYINAFDSKLVINQKNLKSNIKFIKKNYFRKEIWFYLENSKVKSFSSNYLHSDRIGALLNSNLKPSPISKISIYYENLLFREYFELKVPLGIFLLAKYKEEKIDNPFFDYFSKTKFLFNFDLEDDQPMFWLEYLKYINNSKFQYNEIPFLLTSKILAKENIENELESLNLIKKINSCFPQYRALIVFLGLKDDPIFDWNLIEHLWLPYRISNRGEYFSEKNRFLTMKLDEISRKLAISIMISNYSNFGFSEKKIDEKFSRNTTNYIFNEIKKKKSIIQYYFDNFDTQKNHMTQWNFLEEFIRKILALPLTSGEDLKELAEERDCLKSYLLFEDIFKVIRNNFDGNISLLMQNISIEMGKIEFYNFHNELIYCFYCEIFIYLKQSSFLLERCLNYQDKALNIISYLIYYLYIWTNRLSNRENIQMLFIVNKTFERILLFIEFLFFSIPFEISNKMILYNSNNDIFTWWYNSVLKINQKAFKAGKLLISLNSNMKYFESLHNKRWEFRKIYKNSPWFYSLLNFETNVYIFEAYSEPNTKFSKNIIISSSMLAMRLLQIQNYDGLINLVNDSELIKKNLISTTLDSIIFYSLIENFQCNFQKISDTINILIPKLNKNYETKFNLNGDLSTIEVLEVIISYLNNKLYHKGNEIGWLLYFLPKLYLSYIVVDFCICIGDKNLYILEIAGKIQHIIDKYLSYLDSSFTKAIHTTLNKLNLFFESNNSISLTRYIMEIDTLPQKSSQLKMHLDKIQNKKVITTTLAQYLNYLVEPSKSVHILNNDHFLNITQILLQSLKSLENCENSKYLYSVLFYIHRIINLLFSTLENNQIPPILKLTPNEIISSCFFNNKSLNKINELSNIMNVDFILVFVKTLNNCFTNYKKFPEDSKFFEQLEYLFSNYVLNCDSFAIIVHNILPCQNINYNYTTWKYALKKLTESKPEKKIMKYLLHYRIWKLKILKLLNSNSRKFISFSKKLQLIFSISSKYTSYLHKWINLIETAFYFDEKESKKLVVIINTNTDTYYNFSGPNFLLNELEFQIRNFSIKKILESNEFKLISPINRKIFINFMDYESIINFIIQSQAGWDPYLFLSIIDISVRKLRMNCSSMFLGFIGNNGNIIQESITFLILQRLFCTSFLKHFNKNNHLWNQWNLIIRNWNSVAGIIIIINFLLKYKLFSIARFACNKLLYSILERNKKEDIEKELEELFSNNEIIQEIRPISNLNNYKLVLEINHIISIMQNNFGIKKWNFNLFKDLFISEKFQNFNYLIDLFNSISDIRDKYLFVDNLLTSQNFILDSNQINVLKTVSISLKMIDELKIVKYQNSYIYCPYLIVRMAIINKKRKIIEILAKEIDVFLRPDGILLTLIKESFGILTNELNLIEKIKSSSIFGKANLISCLRLFTNEKKTEINFFNEMDINVKSLDISFSIKLLSLLPKRKDISDFIFEIADELSKQLYFLTQKFIFMSSLIRPSFEKNNFVWTNEEGSLRNVSDNLHPFSRFKIAGKSLCYTKYSSINAYKKKKPPFNESKSLIYDTFSQDNFPELAFLISKLRIKMKNLNQLLCWALKNTDYIKCYIAVKCIPLLFELWYRIPGTIFTLKDLVSPDKEIITILISVDQLELAENIITLNNIESEDRNKKVSFFEQNLDIKNLLTNSRTISNISQYYNYYLYKFNNDFGISTNSSRSRNELILDIFQKRWKITQTKKIYINNINDESASLIENFIFTKSGFLNLDILNIFLASVSWIVLILQSKMNHLNSKLPIPLEYMEISRNKFDISLIFELYGKIILSNQVIKKKHINTDRIIFSRLRSFYSKYEELSERNFQDSNNNLNIDHIVFALERTTNIFKEKVFLIDKNIKLNSRSQLNIDDSFQPKISSLSLGLSLNKLYKYNFINQLLLQSEQNHVLTIKYLVKLNFWWEVMIYILRWSFEIGSTKLRSLSLNEKKDSNLQLTNERVAFDDLFYELVIKTAHSTNKLNVLINALNQALPFGGPRAVIAVRRCKQTIQKYLEYHGALEMLYMSLISISLTYDMPHAIAGTIAIHLSLINHINVDARIGYLESALYHFSVANWSLKRRTKMGFNKKRNKSLYSNTNSQNSEQRIGEGSSNTNQNTIEQFNTFKDVLIKSIADVPISKLNTSPWGGLSQTSLERIIRLVELQTYIVNNFLKEDAYLSLLNPNYQYRRDTILKLFLKQEYSLAFKASELLDVPLLEILVLTTKEFIKSYSTNEVLLQFLDSMKYWLSTDDSDALISNAVNMWISENKINLNNLRDFQRENIMELLNKLENPLSRNEAYNMIQSAK